jgi:hypothetical protein
MSMLDTTYINKHSQLLLHMEIMLFDCLFEKKFDGYTKLIKYGSEIWLARLLAFQTEGAGGGGGSTETRIC